MPITLPAHAAAVLPFRRWAPALPMAALVVGATSPDLAYLAGRTGAFSHSAAGLLCFCLPAGLAAWLWAELLVLPTLRRTLPSSTIRWARFLVTRGLPHRAQDWALGLVAILIGAATHVLWDGFTHRFSWPARVLYPHVGWHVFHVYEPLARSLQRASSLFASIGVLIYLGRRYPSLPDPVDPPQRGFLWVLALPTVAWFAGLSFRLTHRIYSDPMDVRWSIFWTATSAGLLMLTAVCGVLTASRSRVDAVE